MILDYMIVFAELTHIFNRRVIDGITNWVGVVTFLVGEGNQGIKSAGAVEFLLIF